MVGALVCLGVFFGGVVLGGTVIVLVALCKAISRDEERRNCRW